MQRILQPGEIEALDAIHFPRVRLPQPATLFQERAARLRQLATDDHPIADYLRFAARLVDIQRQLAPLVPEAEPPSPEQIERASRNGMPLRPASDGLPAAWHDTLHTLLARLMENNAATTTPLWQAALAPVCAQLAAHDATALDALAKQAIAEELAPDHLAAAPLIMAALQVVFTCRAAALDPAHIPFAEPATICPVCGCAPVASVLRIGGEAGGHRYLHCTLCATEWHMVRVKCSHCESTQGVRYQGMQGRETDATSTRGVRQTVLAETCTQCHTYRKLVNQESDPYADPLADDLASITLDLLMGDTPFARASGHPLLAMGNTPT